MTEASNTITTLVQGLAVVLAAARKNGLAEPMRVTVSEHDAAVDISMQDEDALFAWAAWAEAEVTNEEPRPYSGAAAGSDEWVLHQRADGTIYDLPVRLSNVEFGVMAPADYFECKRCGASFGATAGFIRRGEYDDNFEVEVASHQSGECVGAVLPA